MQQAVFIYPNERILTLIQGKIGFRKGVLYLTNQRIIFGQGTSANIESISFEIPLSQIQTIKAHTSGLLHDGQIELVSFANKNWFFQCADFNLNSPFVYHAIEAIKGNNVAYIKLEKDSIQQTDDNLSSNTEQNAQTKNKIFSFMKKVGIALKILLNYGRVLWRYGNRFSKNGKTGWRISYLIVCLIIFIIIAVNINACTNSMNDAVVRASTTIVTPGDSFKARDNLTITVNEITNVTYGESRFEMRIENSGRKAVEYTTNSDNIQSLISFPSGFIGFNDKDWGWSKTVFGLEAPNIAVNGVGSDNQSGVIDANASINVIVTLKYEEEQYGNTEHKMDFEYFRNGRNLPSARWSLLLRPETLPDPEPPKILTVDISPSAQNISISDKVEIAVTFDQKMNREFGEILLSTTGSGDSLSFSGGELTWSSDEKVVCNPTGLKRDSTYTIIISGFISAENKLWLMIEENSSYTITTRGVTDFTGLDARTAVEQLEKEGFTVKVEHADTRADFYEMVMNPDEEFPIDWLVVKQEKSGENEITLIIDTQENIDEKNARIEMLRQLEINLPLSEAWRAFDNYGEANFPWGWKRHSIVGVIAETPVDENTWFLKCEVTITNAFNATRRTVAEANISGDGFFATVTYFFVY